MYIDILNLLSSMTGGEFPCVIMSEGTKPQTPKTFQKILNHDLQASFPVKSVDVIYVYVTH